ncbi:MAG: CHC2 zinc finger domain-containing protein [Desulfobacteraceae bacterium]|jgi:hypothetical protein|nr:CHC2 zinc finger domain-containing protein [Desulfobacteraceae bacterium]
MTPYEIQAAKQTLNIVQVVEQSGIQIKKHGQNYFGGCPFHDEKTPSFSVSPSKQMFHCFGCGARGDVIEYVKKYYRLDFPGALQFLGIKDQTPKTKKQISRITRKQKHNTRREQRQKAAYFEFDQWVVAYSWQRIGLIKVVEDLLKNMTFDECKQLDGVLKKLSVWRYHLELIESNDEKVLYELYCEKNRKYRSAG